MPPNAIKMHVMHTKRKVKSILLFFPLILNHSVRSDYIPKKTVTCNNAVTQCHVDGFQRSLRYQFNLVYNPSLQEKRSLRLRPKGLRSSVLGLRSSFLNLRFRPIPSRPASRSEMRFGGEKVAI